MTPLKNAVGAKAPVSKETLAYQGTGKSRVHRAHSGTRRVSPVKAGYRRILGT